MSSLSRVLLSFVVYVFITVLRSLWMMCEVTGCSFVGKKAEKRIIESERIARFPMQVRKCLRIGGSWAVDVKVSCALRRVKNIERVGPESAAT